MHKEIIRFSKSSITYGIGHILSRAVPFLLLPIYTNFLNINELGAAFYLIAGIAIFNVIYLFGFDVSLIRFYVLAETTKEKKNIFSTGLISVFFISSILSAILLLNSDTIAGILNSGTTNYFNSKIINICVLTLFFDAIGVYSFIILRAEEKAKRFLVLRLLANILTLALNFIYIVILKSGISGVFLSNLYSSIFALILISPTIFRCFKFEYSANILKNLVKFGFPYIFSGIAIISMDLMDRIILKHLKGLEDVALYGANYRIAMIMAIIVAAFRFAWHPFFLSVSKQENAKRIFSKIFTLYTLVTFFVLILFSMITKDLVKIEIFGRHIISQEYWQGIQIIPVIMLSYLFYGAYVNFIIGIYLKNRSIYIPFVVVSSSVINLTLNFLLIPGYGLWGAAVATVISYFIMMLLMFIINNRLYPIKYEYAQIAKIIFSSAIAFAIYYSNFSSNNLLNSTISISVFTILQFLLKVIKPGDLRKLSKEIKT
ncbi:oligosaccharide flippase family protein [candidate division KSB1 bacterium]